LRLQAGAILGLRLDRLGVFLFSAIHGLVHGAKLNQRANRRYQAYSPFDRAGMRQSGRPAEPVDPSLRSEGRKRKESAGPQISLPAISGPPKPTAEAISRSRSPKISPL